MHLTIEVQEREAERLKVQLLHATEELEYLKQHQDIEMREALEQALRNNRLLEATVGDLRDELKSAKDALVSQGGDLHCHALPSTFSMCVHSA